MLSSKALVNAASSDAASPCQASIRLGRTTPAVPTNRMIAAKAIPKVTMSCSRRAGFAPGLAARRSVVLAVFAVNPAPWVRFATLA